MPSTKTFKGWSTLELARGYFHNSEIQRQCSWGLLGAHPFKGDEKVLDFGCGDGKVSAEISHCVPKGNVTGVDLSEAMIQWAKLYFPPQGYPNLKFIQTYSPNFDELDKNLLYDRIVSFYVFHLVPDPVTTLNNLYKHLKNDGKFLAVIPSVRDSNLTQAALETLDKFKLEAVRKTSQCTIEWAEKTFEQTNFKLNFLELETRRCFFADSHEMIQWMVGSYTAIMEIPMEISQEFFTAVFQRWCEIEPSIVDNEGRVRFHFDRLKIVATK